jgi:hypothetical protein
MTSIASFFEEGLKELNCSDDTRAYVVGVFAGFRTSEGDLSNHSITLLFAEAREKHSVLAYQRLADWVFWASVMAREHLNSASFDYYQSVGQLSYYSCYQLMQRQWKLYERMADEFPYLSETSRQLLSERIDLSLPSAHGINRSTIQFHHD